MFAALALSIAPVVAAAGPPAQGMSEVGAGAHIELLARVEPTRFSAEALGPRTALLVFGDAQGVRAVQALAPGARYEARFPARALNGLYMEVLRFDGATWQSTGALDLSDVVARSFEAVLVDNAPAGMNAVGERNGLREPIAPRGSLTGAGTQAAATHVPVVTPEGKKTGDLPPRLEEKPLPPL